MFTVGKRSFPTLGVILVTAALAAAALGAQLLLADREVVRPIVRTLESIDPARPHFVEDLTVVAPWRPHTVAAHGVGHGARTN